MSDIKLACDVVEQVRAICDKHWREGVREASGGGCKESAGGTGVASVIRKQLPIA